MSTQTSLSNSQHSKSTQCSLLSDPSPKQDATSQVDMAAEDETWSLDGEIQQEMERLVLKKLK